MTQQNWLYWNTTWRTWSTIFDECCICYCCCTDCLLL